MKALLLYLGLIFFVFFSHIVDTCYSDYNCADCVGLRVQIFACHAVMT